MPKIKKKKQKKIQKIRMKKKVKNPRTKEKIRIFLQKSLNKTADCSYFADKQSCTHVIQIG